MANYTYLSDAKAGDSGKYWYRIGDDGTYHSYLDKDNSISNPNVIKDWTDISKNTTAINNLKTNKDSYETWNQPLFDPTSKIQVPNNWNGELQKGRIDLSRKTPSTTTDNVEQKKNITHNLFERDTKSIGEQQQFNKYKTIGDTLLTAGAMLGNLTAKRPEAVKAPVVTPPTYSSVIPEYKNAMDRSAAGEMAGATKVIQETGRPDLMPALQANMLSNENAGYGTLAEKDIQQKNLQAGANAEAINKTSEMGYNAKIQDNEMMDKINSARSELLAKMNTSLFSTIPNTYEENKASLVNMQDKQMLYKYLIEQKGYSPEVAMAAFESFLKQYGGQ